MYFFIYSFSFTQGIECWTYMATFAVNPVFISDPIWYRSRPWNLGPFAGALFPFKIKGSTGEKNVQNLVVIVGIVNQNCSAYKHHLGITNGFPHNIVTKFR